MTRTLFFEVGLKLLLAAGLATALFMPAAAQAPGLAMLDGLSAGQWEIRYRGSAVSERICLRNGRQLIQLRHPGEKCTRIVVEDGAEQVTVQYTCRGNGYGRTNIRKETASLVQIDGQGIVGTKHYEFTAEGRRIGSCSS